MKNCSSLPQVKRSQRHVKVGAATAALSPTSSSEKKCPLTLGTKPYVLNESQWPKVLAPMTGSGLRSGSTFSVTQLWLLPKVKDMDLDNTEALLKITLTCPINTTSRHTAKLNPCLVAFHSTCSSTDQTASYKHFPCSPLTGKHWLQEPHRGTSL